MNLQGAELLALKGLGDYLNNVKYIYTEASYKEIYLGQVMFNELNKFILSNNFSIVNNLTLKGWQEDVIYEKNINNEQVISNEQVINNEQVISNEQVINNEQVISNENLYKYENIFFSQNGEDGIILEIISRLNIINSYYVVYGTQDSMKCNSRILREKYN